MGSVLIFLVLLMFVPPLIAVFVFISRYREGKRDTGAKDKLFEAMMEMQNRKKEKDDILADDSNCTEKNLSEISGENESTDNILPKAENDMEAGKIPEEKNDKILADDKNDLPKAVLEKNFQPDSEDSKTESAASSDTGCENDTEQLKKEEALKKVSEILERNKTKKTKNPRAELFDALGEISKRNKR